MEVTEYISLVLISFLQTFLSKNWCKPFFLAKCRLILEHLAEEPDNDHELRCVWFSYLGATWLYLLTIANEATACRRQRRAIIRTHPTHKVCQPIVCCSSQQIYIRKLLLNPQLPCPCVTVSLCFKHTLNNYCCRGKGWCPASSLFSWIQGAVIHDLIYLLDLGLWHVPWQQFVISMVDNRLWMHYISHGFAPYQTKLDADNYNWLHPNSTCFYLTHLDLFFQIGSTSNLLSAPVVSFTRPFFP